MNSGFFTVGGLKILKNLAGRRGVNTFGVLLNVALYRAYFPVIRQLFPYSLIGAAFSSFLSLLV
jgi:hypothetical protein